MALRESGRLVVEFILKLALRIRSDGGRMTVLTDVHCPAAVLDGGAEVHLARP